MTNDVKLQNTVSTKKQPAKRRRKSASLDRRKAAAGWIFVLPFLIGFVFVYFPIIFNSIKLSFFEMSGVTGGGYDLTFVGFENYRQALFVDPKFVQTLFEGLGKMLLEIPAIIIFSLFMAVLLNQKMAGRAAFRAILFVPVILSTGLMAQIEAPIGEDESMDTGMEETVSSQFVSAIDIQRLLSGMAIGNELVQVVVNWVNDIFNIVNRSGVQMLIFLSGLQSISPAIYESCQIDGATAWETFWKITFPMISPMILVNAVYTVIDSFTSETNTIMKFISDKYSQAGGNAISSAMSWMYFLIVMVIVAIIAGICSAFVFYQRRND